MRDLAVSILRQHLAGRRVPIPECLQPLWSIFCDLSAARSYGFGANPISHSDLDAYCRLHRWPLCPHHIAVIRAMDDEWLKAASKKQSTPDAAAPRNSSLTPQFFDAMFR